MFLHSELSGKGKLDKNYIYQPYFNIDQGRIFLGGGAHHPIVFVDPGEKFKNSVFTVRWYYYSLDLKKI